MAKIYTRIEYFIFILSVFMFTGGLSGIYLKLFNLNPPLPIQFVHLPIMILMLPVILVRLKEAVFGLFSLIPFTLLALLAIISYKWSLDGAVTVRESITFLFLGTYLVTMAWTLTWQQIINGLWVAMFSMGLISLLVYFGMPKLGSMSEIHSGALSGLWLEKNSAGQIGTFGAMLALARFAISPKIFVTSGASFIIFTLILLLSTSKTALVAYLIACALFGWVFIMRRNFPLFIAGAWTTLFGGAFIGNWIWYNKEMFFELMGRNATFTGRAEIWKALEASTSDRPLLGHGYSAYWNPDYTSTTLSYVLDDLKYYPNHSHNSWVEMTLGLGQVGSYLLTAIVVIGIGFALFRLRSSHGSYFAVPFLFSACLIGSFESILTYPSNFGGAVLILVAAKVVRMPSSKEQQHALRRMFSFLGHLVQQNQRANTPVPVHGPIPAPIPMMREAQQRPYAPRLYEPRPYLPNPYKASSLSGPKPMYC